MLGSTSEYPKNRYPLFLRLRRALALPIYVLLLLVFGYLAAGMAGASPSDRHGPLPNSSRGPTKASRAGCCQERTRPSPSSLPRCRIRNS
jgi:hypothetical protein